MIAVAPMAPLVYLQKQIGQDFFKQWKSLSDTDKATLKGWARDEMTVLGLPILAG